MTSPTVGVSCPTVLLCYNNLASKASSFSFKNALKMLNYTAHTHFDSKCIKCLFLLGVVNLLAHADDIRVCATKDNKKVKPPTCRTSSPKHLGCLPFSNAAVSQIGRYCVLLRVQV